MTTQFRMRQAVDGSWTIYNTATNQPALLNGIPLVSKELDEADDLVDLLNGLDADGERVTQHLAAVRVPRTATG